MRSLAVGSRPASLTSVITAWRLLRAQPGQSEYQIDALADAPVPGTPATQLCTAGLPAWASAWRPFSLRCAPADHQLTGLFVASPYHPPPEQLFGQPLAWR